jgi:hypothetical protein
MSLANEKAIGGKKYVIKTLFGIFYRNLSTNFPVSHNKRRSTGSPVNLVAKLERIRFLSCFLTQLRRISMTDDKPDPT